MDKFIEELNTLSETLLEEPELDSENDKINSDAMEMLFKYAETGVGILNSKGLNHIKIYRLSSDLVPLFFHFECSGDGFLVSTNSKYLFFMQSAEQNIFIYGKNKKNQNRLNSGEKIQQLFNIDYKEKNGKTSFFDNTNKELKADEIVFLALKWSLN